MDAGNLGANPFTMLPEEIWRIIIVQLLNAPGDLQSCSKTCSQWAYLVEDTKTSWLFSLILPMLFYYLPTKDVLNLRQVSKMWRTSVDNFLEEDSDHKALSKNPKCRCRDCRRDEWTVKLVGNAQISKFMFDFRDLSPKENPFVGRSVKLSGIHAPIHFIRTYGQHLWYVTLNVQSDDRFRRQIPEGLSHLQNIRLLMVNQQLDRLELKLTRKQLKFTCSSEDQMNTLLQLPSLPEIERLIIGMHYPLRDNPKHCAAEHCKLLSTVVKKYSGKSLRFLSLHFHHEFLSKEELFANLPYLQFDPLNLGHLVLTNATVIPAMLLEKVSHSLEALTLRYEPACMMYHSQAQPDLCIEIGNDAVVVPTNTKDQRPSATDVEDPMFNEDERHQIFEAAVWDLLPKMDCLTIGVDKLLDEELTGYFTREERYELVTKDERSLIAMALMAVLGPILSKVKNLATTAVNVAVARTRMRIEMKAKAVQGMILAHPKVEKMGKSRKVRYVKRVVGHIYLTANEYIQHKVSGI